MAIRCPACGASTPPDDVNVGTDTALCRACGVPHRLSSIVEERELLGDPDAEPHAPPRGTWCQDDGLTIRIGARCGWPALRLFILGFAVIWNGATWLFAVVSFLALLAYVAPHLVPASLAPTSNSAQMPLLMAILFLVFITPFVVIGVVMLGYALLLTFGRTEVRLRGPEGEVFTGIGALGRVRRFDAAAVRDVRIRRTGYKIQIVREHDQTEVVIDGKILIRFGASLSDDRQRYLAGVLRAVLVPATPPTLDSPARGDPA